MPLVRRSQALSLSRKVWAQILAKHLLCEMESGFRFIALPAASRICPGRRRYPRTERVGQRRNTCCMNCLIGYWITVCTFDGSSSGRINILSVVPGLRWVRMVLFMSALSCCT